MSRTATPAERELWLAAQLGDDPSVFTAAHAFDVPGEVDAGALATAWDGLCRAATVLTARFDASGGELIVLAQPERASSLEVVHAADADRAAAVIDHVRATAFDATVGPLARAVLVRDAERGGDTIVVAVSHLAADGYGWSVLLRELELGYAAARAESIDGRAAHAAGRPRALADAGALDPVARQTEKARAEEAHASGWWAAHLASLPHPARGALPLRQARPRACRPLPTTPRGAPLPALALAAAALAAAIDPERVASRRRIVVDVPLLARDATALRQAGTAMNVIPVVVDLGVLEADDRDGGAARERGSDSEAAAVAALLANCEAAIDEVRPHAQERAETARRARTATGAPPPRADVAMNLIPFSHELRLDGRRVAAATLSSGPGDVAAVGVRAQPGGGYVVEADAPGRDGRANEEASRRLAARFATAFGALAVGELPRGVRRGVLAERADGGPGAGVGGDVLERIASHVVAAPHRAAFVDPTAALRRGSAGGSTGAPLTVTTSYGELWRSASDLAERLREIGLGPETLVGVCAPRGPEYAAGVLGALLAGAAFVPIASESEARVARRRTLEVIAVDVVVVDERGGVVAADLDTGAPVIVIGASGPGSLDATEPPPASVARAPVVHRDQTAYVIATSGSTGLPKPVVISRGALAAWLGEVLDDYLPVSPGDRIAQFAAVQFDASVEELFGALCAGATLVPRGEAALERVGDWLDECARLGVTVLDLPTGYWHELVVALAAGQAALPPSVHTVIIGGEAASPERVRQWREHLRQGGEHHAPRRVRLVNTYGPTEATVVATRQVLTR